MDSSSLSNLHDIFEPAAVSWWPPAPGAVLIGLLFLLWVGLAALRLWRRWRRNAYRREALRELGAIRERANQPQSRGEAIRQLSALLKRVALAAYPRARVASLTGEQWRDFLDRQVGGGTFSSDNGRVLAITLVDPNPGAGLTASDCERLIQAVRRWITGHRTGDNSPRNTGGGGVKRC